MKQVYHLYYYTLVDEDGGESDDRLVVIEKPPEGKEYLCTVKLNDLVSVCMTAVLTDEKYGKVVMYTDQPELNGGDYQGIFAGLADFMMTLDEVNGK